MCFPPKYIISVGRKTGIAIMGRKLINLFSEFPGFFPRLFISQIAKDTYQFVSKVTRSSILILHRLRKPLHWLNLKFSAIILCIFATFSPK